MVTNKRAACVAYVPVNTPQSPKMLKDCRVLDFNENSRRLRSLAGILYVKLRIDTTTTMASIGLICLPS